MTGLVTGPVAVETVEVLEVVDPGASGGIGTLTVGKAVGNTGFPARNKKQWIVTSFVEHIWANFNKFYIYYIKSYSIIYTSCNP